MNKIAIIGCGSMGVNYAAAFLKNSIVSQKDILMIEKNAGIKERLRSFGYVHDKIDEKIREFEIIILSVKPQDAKPVLHELRNYINPQHVIISIMAGVTITTLQETLSHSQIIRAMPNTPASLGMGITGFCASANASVQSILKADNLLNTTGKTVFFEDEEKLNAVTALSGSGPAYFYYIASAMIEAGKKMGIEESVSALLVKQTMNGAFHLLNQAEGSIEDLIKTVASRGGTTEAALESFKNSQLKESIVNGILEAEKRAKELSKIH